LEGSSSLMAFLDSMHRRHCIAVWVDGLDRYPPMRAGGKGQAADAGEGFP